MHRSKGRKFQRWFQLPPSKDSVCPFQSQPYYTSNISSTDLVCFQSRPLKGRRCCLIFLCCRLLPFGSFTMSSEKIHDAEKGSIDAQEEHHVDLAHNVNAR